MAQKPSGRLTATHFSPYINIYDLLKNNTPEVYQNNTPEVYQNDFPSLTAITKYLLVRVLGVLVIEIITNYI